MAAWLLIAATTADAGPFEDADRAAQESRLGDMQAIYEQILESDPANVRALTGKAAAQAWQGDYLGAQATYASALRLAPDDLNARIGLGYAFAWAGDYTKAHSSFHAALKTDPFNLGARKGIGYTYLWSGDYELALDSFDLASSIAPTDAEIAEASGHASLELGHARDAIASYQKTLTLDPQRKSAERARHAAYTRAPALEVSARYGSTSDVDSGLRSVEVAHWPTLSTRLNLRYDDSLSLDNRTLAQRGNDAPGYYFGVQQTVGSRWMGLMEFGQRQLLDGDQNLASLGIVRHKGASAMKVGAQIGRHDAGYTDSLLFGSLAFPVFEKWQIEPAVYVSEFGAADDNEWRAVINTMFQPDPRWHVGLRIGQGEIDALDPANDGRTTLLGAWASVYVNDQTALDLSLRHEKSPTETLDIALLGITYRIPRN